jgi:hypothetical protein
MGSLKGQAHEMAIIYVYALMVYTVHPSQHNVRGSFLKWNLGQNHHLRLFSVKRIKKGLFELMSIS